MGIDIWASTYGHRHMGIDIWASTYGHQHMGIDIWALTYGHRHMGIDIWASTHGHVLGKTKLPENLMGIGEDLYFQPLYQAKSRF
ncbi:hypothetical protein ACOMHN_039500 [Nucella lapillus]